MNARRGQYYSSRSRLTARTLTSVRLQFVRASEQANPNMMDHDDTRTVKGAGIRVYSSFVFACIRREMRLRGFESYSTGGCIHDETISRVIRCGIRRFVSISREILSILIEASFSNYHGEIRSRYSLYTYGQR